ncbi:MAG: hypothetical protein IJ300_05050 [Clostridia bacterium]|nr:hypothetical protein [Clostridia bacterium]
MKKLMLLISGIISLLSMMAICAYADDVPTAKVSATLVGDEIPIAGEKFTVAINVNEISSNLFVAGEAILNWPVEAVSLADSYYDEPVIVTDNYCLENIYNQKIGRTGKFEFISNFDRASSGRAAVAIYISLSSGDQTADVVSNLTMFEISFVLNEGYDYDDFYLEIEDTILFLTADKWTVSRYKDGKIELTGLGVVENNNYANEPIQSGYLLTTITETAVNENIETVLNTNINLIYDNEYHESVLIKNNTLDVNISIENTGTANKELVCYVAEYDLAGCMLGLSANKEIIIGAGESVSTNVTKTFDIQNTESAKIFLWEKGTLVPVGNNITLTIEPTDYYADEKTDANLVEINKQICGEINISDDVDVVKITTTEAGCYVVKLSADNTASYALIDSENNTINTTAIDNNYAIYNLQENSTYYLKITGSEDDTYHIKPMLAESSVKNIGSEGYLNDSYDYELFEFVPETGCEYIITAVGTEGVKAVLHNSNFEQIKVSDSRDDYVSFRITHNMTANEKYYIIVEQNATATNSTSYELYVEEPFEIISIY